jgi:hypothetical protein
MPGLALVLRVDSRSIGPLRETCVSAPEIQRCFRTTRRVLGSAAHLREAAAPTTRDPDLANRLVQEMQAFRHEDTHHAGSGRDGVIDRFQSVPQWREWTE